MNNAQFHRTLTTKDLTIYGIVFMIPIAPFAWYGSFIEPSQGMVALAYLIGMIAMLFTGFSYVTMSSRYPIAGSVYSYVQKGTTPALGFLSGWAIILDYLFLPAVCNLVGALFMAELVPGVPFWIWAVVFTLFNTIINVLGIKIVARISWILFGFQMFLIIYFLIGVFRLLGAGEAHFETISFYNPLDFKLSGVLQATAIVVLSYLGFDAISTLSEEAVNPKRAIGRATIYSILSAGVIFIVISYFAGVAFPEFQKLNSDTAFLDILNLVGGKTLVNLSIVALVLSFGFACGFEGQSAVSRILYSMGRDGILPKAIAKVNAKYQTPAFATIFVGIVTVIVSIAVPLGVLANLLSFGALLGFMALNLAVIWHFYMMNKEKNGAAFIKYLLSPILAFIVCGYIFSGLSKDAFIVGGSWMLIGLIYLAVVTKGFSVAAPTLNLSEQKEVNI